MQVGLIMPGTVRLTTALTADAGPNDATIVANTAGFPNAGTLQIESELLTYASLSSAQFGGVVRSANGSTAASHKSGTSVLQILPLAISADEARTMSSVDGDLEIILSGGAQAAGGTTPLLRPLDHYFALDPAQRPAIRDTFRSSLLALLHNLAPPAYVELGTSDFENGWSNSSNAAFNTAAYFKDWFGLVHLKGMVQGGAVGSAVFTLPAGYRPPATTVLATTTSVFAFACLTIANNGIVTVAAGSGAVALDGVSFRATQ
jgi:hypothetical protein